MPQNEPTNEQLQYACNRIECQLIGNHTAGCLGSALLAAREAIAERDSQIAALRARVDELEESATTLVEGISTTITGQRHELDSLKKERDSLRGELENWKDTSAQENRNTQYYRRLIVTIGELFGAVAKTSDDGSVQEDVLCAKVPELVIAMRRELEEAKLELSVAIETGEDISKEFERVNKERDVARAGEARLRLFVEQLPAGDIIFQRAKNEALSSSTDSAKWLEERLEQARYEERMAVAGVIADLDTVTREAEQRGYERGKQEGEIAGLRRVSNYYSPHLDVFDECKREADRLERQLVARREKAEEKWLEERLAEAEQRGYERGKAEGEIAGLRNAVVHWRDGSLWSAAHADHLERQLAARREKAEPEARRG